MKIFNEKNIIDMFNEMTIKDETLIFCDSFEKYLVGKIINEKAHFYYGKKSLSDLIKESESILAFNNDMQISIRKIETESFSVVTYNKKTLNASLSKEKTYFLLGRVSSVKEDWSELSELKRIKPYWIPGGFQVGSKIAIAGREMISYENSVAFVKCVLFDGLKEIK